MLHKAKVINKMYRIELNKKEVEDHKKNVQEKIKRENLLIERDLQNINPKEVLMRAKLNLTL